jgi:hypothetical protein
MSERERRATWFDCNLVQISNGKFVPWILCVLCSMYWFSLLHLDLRYFSFSCLSQFSSLGIFNLTLPRWNWGSCFLFLSAHRVKVRSLFSILISAVDFLLLCAQGFASSSLRFCRPIHFCRFLRLSSVLLRAGGSWCRCFSRRRCAVRAPFFCCLCALAHP